MRRRGFVADIVIAGRRKKANADTESGIPALQRTKHWTMLCPDDSCGWLLGGPLLMTRK